eukprot:1033938-Ditylum_brightwellii.AAC.1
MMQSVSIYVLSNRSSLIKHFLLTVKLFFCTVQRKCVKGRKCAFVKGGLLNRDLGKEALSDEIEYR